MEINQLKTVPVQAKEIRLCLKVRDQFSATLHDQDGQQIGEREDYVPGFFPEDHYGDYVKLHIDIDTGNIVNWSVPSAEELQDAFGLGAPKED